LEDDAIQQRDRDFVGIVFLLDRFFAVPGRKETGKQLPQSPAGFACPCRLRLSFFFLARGLD
jgi:hypothetical protein